MSRFFVNITVADLWCKCYDSFGKGEEGNRYIDFYIIKEKLGKDLKVEFDLENTALSHNDFGPEGLVGLVSLGNGLTFWGMCAGGDWEHPVYWIVYWDGKKLRAYIPTEGNLWNTDTKQAFGNDDVKDLKNAKKRWPEEFKDVLEEDITDQFDFDSGMILNDILNRIKLKK
jgi:hypothetical protein